MPFIDLVALRLLLAAATMVHSRFILKNRSVLFGIDNVLRGAFAFFFPWMSISLSFAGEGLRHWRNWRQDKQYRRLHGIPEKSDEVKSVGRKSSDSEAKPTLSEARRELERCRAFQELSLEDVRRSAARLESAAGPLAVFFASRAHRRDVARYDNATENVCRAYSVLESFGELPSDIPGFNALDFKSDADVQGVSKSSVDALALLESFVRSECESRGWPMESITVDPLSSDRLSSGDLVGFSVRFDDGRESRGSMLCFSSSGGMGFYLPEGWIDGVSVSSLKDIGSCTWRSLSDGRRYSFKENRGKTVGLQVPSVRGRGMSV